MSLDLIPQLQELQVRRKHYIKTANKLTNAAGALTRRALGWNKDGDDAEAIKGRAAKLVAAFMSKGEVAADDHDIAAALATDLLVTRNMLVIAEEARHAIELSMAKMARKLPAYAFAKGVTGFGDLAFAVLIGETGDLAKYDKPDKVWKRLGLAPLNGKAMSNWRKQGGLSADDWVAAGYAPQRRAEVFAVVEDPLFRHQASRKGPYHITYIARRERTAETHPDWTKGHSHADAKRVMVKRLVSDLWSEWRLAVIGAPDRVSSTMPASTTHPSAAAVQSHAPQ